MSITHGGKLPLAIALCVVWLTQAMASENPDQEDFFLWSAPESDLFLLAPLTGWSSQGKMDGAIVGLRGIFAFDNFLGGIHGQSIFVESGAVYLFGLDFHLRHGPLYGGIGLSGHFFPGNLSRPTPSINFQLGLHIPTPFASVFADVAYRPNIVFHKSRNLVYHTFLLGLIFETGT